MYRLDVMSCVQHLKLFGTLTKILAVHKPLFYIQLILSIVIRTLFIDERLQVESHPTVPQYIYSQGRDLVL
jgi:hypothetical protein